MRPLRWGVMGVSEMVGRRAVLPALRDSQTADLVAIASRDVHRARNEAARYGAALAYGDYASLLDDSGVEAVYIPLPNALHLEWTVRAAEAGKHVLCEKPLACAAAEAQQMADACERAGVVLMEAYMTPFHPRSSRAIELARSGALGDLRFAHAAFTFPADDLTNHRWRPEMGGGSLLDVGIYCLEPLRAAAGREPERVHARSVVTPSGVDASFSAWLDFGDGFTATCTTSFEAPERQLLEIVGTRARVTLERAFTPMPLDTQIACTSLDGSTELVTCGGNDPYFAMVEHFAQVVKGHDSPARTPADSIATLRLLDRLKNAVRRE